MSLSCLLEVAPCEQWKIYNASLAQAKPYNYKFVASDYSFYCRTCDEFFDTRVIFYTKIFKKRELKNVSKLYSTDALIVIFCHFFSGNSP
mgnify:CR=1 FL=1